MIHLGDVDPEPIPDWLQHAFPSGYLWERAGEHRYRGRWTLDGGGPPGWCYILTDSQESRYLSAIVADEFAEEFGEQERLWDRLERQWVADPA